MALQAKKVCVWISRHPPHKEQERALAGRYEIVILAGFYKNPAEIWEDVRRYGGKRVGLIVAVLPERFYIGLPGLAGDIPVVRAKMDGIGRWTGEWERVRGVSLVTEPWWPE